MHYRHRKGDKIFFKVLVAASEIPIDEDEVEKATKAMLGGEGIVIFKYGMALAEKINGVVPDLTRMADFADVGPADSPPVLPDIAGNTLKRLFPEEYARLMQSKTTLGTNNAPATPQRQIGLGSNPAKKIS